MSPALASSLEELAVDLGEHLLAPLVDALINGEPDRAERAARFVAETKAAKVAIHKARTEGR